MTKSLSFGSEQSSILRVIA